MFNISSFLEKFRQLGKSKKYAKEVLIKVIKEETGVDIKEEEMEVGDEKVKLKCSPLLRNQIFMYRGAIESSLKSQNLFLKIF